MFHANGYARYYNLNILNWKVLKDMPEYKVLNNSKVLKDMLGSKV
jgi:hypothetical protein